MTTPFVSVRLTPQPEQLLAKDSDWCIESLSRNSLQLLRGKGQGKTFYFDRVFDSKFSGEEASQSSQRQIWLEIGQRLLGSVRKRQNATLLSYGPASSGKSYTCWGDGLNGRQSGIVHTFLEELLTARGSSGDLISSQKIELSVFSVYNETILDLLATPEPDDLVPGLFPRKAEAQLRYHPVFGWYTENLTCLVLSSVEDGQQALEDALAIHALSTLSNGRLPHASCVVASVQIFTKEEHDQEDPSNEHLYARTTFIDLCASNILPQELGDSGADKEHAQVYGQSMLFLQNVLKESYLISQGLDNTQPNSQFIRKDCTLAILLRDALEGRSNLFCVAHLPVTGVPIEVALSTLSDAFRFQFISAKYIEKGKLTSDCGLLNQMRQYITKCLDQISVLKGTTSTNVTSTGPVPTKAKKDEITLAENVLRDSRRILARIETPQESLVEETRVANSKRRAWMESLGLVMTASSRLAHPYLMLASCDAITCGRLAWMLAAEGSSTLGYLFKRPLPSDSTTHRNCIQGLGIRRFHAAISLSSNGTGEVTNNGGGIVKINGSLIENEPQALYDGDCLSLGYDCHLQYIKMQSAEKDDETKEIETAVGGVNVTLSDEVHKALQLKDRLSTPDRLTLACEEANELGRALDISIDFAIQESANRFEGSRSKKEYLIKVSDRANKDTSSMLWPGQSFVKRLHLMRLVYEEAQRCGLSVAMKPNKGRFNPWDKDGEDYIVGEARVHLQSLSFLLEIIGDFSIIDGSGKTVGQLALSLSPILPTDVDTDGKHPDPYQDSALDTRLGKSIKFRIQIKNATFEDVAVVPTYSFVSYSIFTLPETFVTPRYPGQGRVANFQYSKTIDEMLVTPELCRYLYGGTMVFQVWSTKTFAQSKKITDLAVLRLEEKLEELQMLSYGQKLAIEEYKSIIAKQNKDLEMMYQNEANQAAAEQKLREELRDALSKGSHENCNLQTKTYEEEAKRLKSELENCRRELSISRSAESQQVKSQACSLQ